MRHRLATPPPPEIVRRRLSVSTSFVLAALRALGNRWLEVLWHCLIKGVLYDEAVHTANRNRARAPKPAVA